MLIGMYRQLPWQTCSGSLRHRANGRQSRSTRPPTNRKLSDARDKALVNYIMQLYNIGVPFRQKHIAAAAESILRDAMHSIGDHTTPSYHNSLHDSPIWLPPYLIVGQAIKASPGTD